MTDSGVPGLIIGGVAVSLLARARFTKDLDALVILDQGLWAHFLLVGQRHGFEPRVEDCLEFARASRVLLLEHLPSQTEVDVTIGLLPFEIEAVDNGRKINVLGIAIRVPRPEDLVIMKAVANRPQDLADIQSIVEMNPVLDKTYIRKSVEEFAAILEKPEMVADLERIFR